VFLLNSLRLYRPSKKFSALYLQTGKLGLLSRHAVVHLSDPVLQFVPIFSCWLPIDEVCIHTFKKSDIVNIFYSYTLLKCIYSMSGTKIHEKAERAKQNSYRKERIELDNLEKRPSNW
jgi:hypothetical protein